MTRTLSKLFFHAQQRFNLMNCELYTVYSQLCEPPNYANLLLNFCRSTVALILHSMNETT